MDVQVGTLWVTVLLTPMKLPSVPEAAAMAALTCCTRANSGPVSSGGRSASVRKCRRGMTSTWPLNTGRASRNATVCSSAATMG